MTKKSVRKGKKGQGKKQTRQKRGKSQVSLADRGAEIGSYFGGLGSLVGRGLGGGLAAIMGSGAYSVRKNSVLSDLTIGSVPAMHSSNESIHIRHREYLGDIITSSTAGAFQIQGWSINPGVQASFPWLANIAGQFQEYRPLGLVYEYHTLSADALNSTNTALGSVITAVNYNPGNPAFTNKVQMLNSMWAGETKPSSDMMAPVECDMTQSIYGNLYVRTGTVPVGQDVKTYDLGTFYVATTGMQGASVKVGSLWVTYEFELLKPSAFVAQGVNILTAQYDSLTSNNDRTKPTKGFTVVGTDCIGLVVGDNGYTMPSGSAGCFHVTLIYGFQSNITATLSTFAPTYTNAGDAWMGSGGIGAHNYATWFTGTNSVMVEFVYTVVDPAAPVIVAFPSIPANSWTTATSAVMLVEQVNPLAFTP